jgi:hypothetical protein
MGKKARCAAEATTLESIPNIGRSMADDLRQLGIASPGDLIGKDAYTLYLALCDHSGQRQDPCVLDTFIAATRFMAGDPPLPWWCYTAERKRQFRTL